MSLSLSFEVEPVAEGSPAHRPVISSPVQIGAQPVLSESLADFEPEDVHWKIWRVPAGPYESFRKKPLMTLDQLKKTLRENPQYYSPGVEGLFRVLTQRPLANGSAPSKYGKINLFAAHEAMQRGEVQNLFELLLDKVKAFFDLDFSLANRPDLASPQAQAQFISSAIGHLSRHCGFSSDVSDWSVQQTLHEDKFSVHLVLNDNTHFANCAQLKAHLIACNVDFAKYGIDTHVYATAQLRALGSGKEWDAANFKPKLLRGINHANITFPEFASGLVQFIPLGSRLLEVDMPQPQGRMRQVADLSLMQEEIEEIVKALGEIYQQELDPIADVSAKSILENTFLCFDVDSLVSCQCDKGRGAKIIADIRPHRKVLRLQRKVFCCREATIGYTVRSALYLDMLAQLDFYRVHGLDNLSTSIYDHPNACYRGAGFFETSPQEICLKLGVEMPERWTYFYIPDSGNLVDEQFFKFVRDDRPGLFNPNASDRDVNFKDCELTKKRLNSYMALFACCVQQTNNWYIRSKIGIIPQKKASVQTEMFGVCHYEEMRTKGRGDDKEIIFVQKPYWSFFEKSSVYLKAGLTMGAYDPLNKEVISLTPPKQVDVRKAMMLFLNLSEGDKACLRALWATYLKMAVLHEIEETRSRMKDFLERWVMTVMFDTFKAAMMMVIFMSTGGGQGKSSLGHFICSFLGYELSMTGATVAAVLKGTTNKGSNGFIFFDEMKDGDAIDELKEAITAPMVRVRYLYENPYMEKSKRILMGCTNHRFIASVNPSGRKDRRFFILYWVDVEQMEIMENGKFFNYVCEHCPVRRNRFGEALPCSKHGFVDHSSFMDRFHTLITNKPVEEENLYTNGPLFEAFVGMLYSGYLEKKAGWRGTLQSEMPVTKATEECQTKVQTLAGKYIEACNQRKFHWHPSQSPSEKTIWVIEKTMANLQFEQMRSQKPVWIQYVPRATLYQNFCQWVKASGSHKIAENVFLDQLDEICRSRNGYSIYDKDRFKMVQCENLIYSRDGGEMFPSFKNNNDHAFDHPVIDMHTGPWIKAPLRRSESVVLEPSPPQSLSSAEAVAPVPEPPRRLAESTTRGVILSARERAEEQARYEEEMELREQNRERAALGRIYDEADAQDGFDIGFKRAREGVDEEVDHDLQDQMAMEEDDELEQLFLRGAKFLRTEAVESEGEDSGEPSYVSNSFGHSL